MSSLQIRDVPEVLKRILKTRAPAAGQSLSEYSLTELRQSTERPTLPELIERIRRRGGPIGDFRLRPTFCVRNGRALIVLDTSALADLADLAAVRHAHDIYLARAREPRENLSGYDAVCVALAEALAAPLLTCDGRLARAAVSTVRVELVTAWRGAPDH